MWSVKDVYEPLKNEKGQMNNLVVEQKQCYIKSVLLKCVGLCQDQSSQVEFLTVKLI